MRGILPATLAAQQAGFSRVIVLLRQAGEAKLVEGIEVFGVASITQLVASLRGVPMRRDALEVSAVHSLAGSCDHHGGVCRRDHLGYRATPLPARLPEAPLASSATCWRRSFQPSEPSSVARPTIPSFSAINSTTASESLGHSEPLLDA